MYAVIIGGGDFGIKLLELFLEEGWKVCLVDKNPKICRMITNVYGVRSINGDGIDPETLDEAEIEEADVFIAATPKTEINILSGILAKEKGAHRIIVRVSDKSYGAILNKIGFEPVIPEEIAASYLFEHIAHPNIKRSAGFYGFYVFEIYVDETLFIIGKKLKDLEKEGIKIIYFREDKNSELKEYDPEKVIKAGMYIYAISRDKPGEIISRWTG